MVINKKKKNKKKKKKSQPTNEFCCLGGPQSEIKENEKKDKYLDFVWEFKKLWDIQVTVIPVDALGTDSKGLERELGEWKIGGWHVVK